MRHRQQMHCDHRNGKYACGKLAVRALVGVTAVDGSKPLVFRCAGCPGPTVGGPFVLTVAIDHIALCNCGNVPRWAYNNGNHLLTRCDAHREPSLLATVEQLVEIQRNTIRDEVDMYIGRRVRHMWFCRRCQRFQPCPELGEIDARLSLLRTKEIEEES